MLGDIGFPSVLWSVILRQETRFDNPRKQTLPTTLEIAWRPGPSASRGAALPVTVQLSTPAPVASSSRIKFSGRPISVN